MKIIKLIGLYIQKAIIYFLTPTGEFGMDGYELQDEINQQINVAKKSLKKT